MSDKCASTEQLGIQLATAQDQVKHWRNLRQVVPDIAQEQTLRDELFRMTRLDGKRQHDILELHTQLAATERKYLDMERRHRESERQLAVAHAAMKQVREYLTTLASGRTWITGLTATEWLKSLPSGADALDAAIEKPTTKP